MAVFFPFFLVRVNQISSQTTSLPFIFKPSNPQKISQSPKNKFYIPSSSRAFELPSVQLKYFFNVSISFGIYFDIGSLAQTESLLRLKKKGLDRDIEVSEGVELVAGIFLEERLR